MDAVQAIKDYDVHLDSKNRFTVRGAKYAYYNVKEYSNGCITLEPRKLQAPEGISESVLAQMDQAVKNFKAGNVYGPIDLTDI